MQSYAVQFKMKKEIMLFFFLKLLASSSVAQVWINAYEVRMPFFIEWLSAGWKICLAQV